MHMSPEAFEDYAAKLERDDFEDDVRSLNARYVSTSIDLNVLAISERVLFGLFQLVAAREDTIKKLRDSADYLDSIWYR